MFRRRPVAHIAYSLAAAFLTTSLIPASAAEPDGKQSGNAAASVTATSPAVAKRPDRVDQFGDPLPKGAVARLGTCRLRHGERAVGVAFSPDGKTLASCSSDAAIRFWDAKTGQPLQKLLIESGLTNLDALAFSPDGTKLLSGGSSGVRLWDLKSGKPLFQQTDQLVFGCSAAFAPDGKTFASAAKHEPVQVWDVETRKVLNQLKMEGGGDDHPIAYSLDGSYLACADDLSIHIWNLRTGGQPLLIEHKDWEITSLAFQKDGRRLISGGDRSTTTTDALGNREYLHRPSIRVWDIRTGAQVGEFACDNDLSHGYMIALTPDGKTLVSAHYRKMLIWDFASAKVMRTIPLESRDDDDKGSYKRTWSYGLAISPDGKTVACIGPGTTAGLWDLTTGQPLGNPREAHSNSVLSICYAADGKTVATAGEDQTVRLWDPSTGRPLRTLEPGGGPVRSVLFSPNGQAIIAAGEAYKDDKNIGLVATFDPATGKMQRRFNVPECVSVASLSPDGKLLATAAGYGKLLRATDPLCLIQIWETDTWKLRTEFRGHEGEILRMAFFPDGKTLATAAKDNMIRLWDVSSGGEMQGPTKTRGAVISVVFTPDFKTAFTGNRWSDFIRQWDLSSRKQISVLKMPNSQECYLALSPNGESLAASYQSWPPLHNSIRLWSVRDGREIRRLDTADTTCAALAFSPDGHALVSGMQDGSALVWDLTIPQQ